MININLSNATSIRYKLKFNPNLKITGKIKKKLITLGAGSILTEFEKGRSSPFTIQEYRKVVKYSPGDILQVINKKNYKERILHKAVKNYYKISPKYADGLLYEIYYIANNLKNANLERVAKWSFKYKCTEHLINRLFYFRNLSRKIANKLIALGYSKNVFDNISSFNHEARKFISNLDEYKIYSQTKL